MSRFRYVELSDPRFEIEGLRFITFKSPRLRGRADVAVALPPGQLPADVPTVTLLHGVQGSHWAWALKGGAHRTLARMVTAKEIPPMVLVMPSDGLFGDGSGYVQHGTGIDYERFIIEDVHDVVCEVFSEVTAASKRYINGLSMGGFGAMRLGAKYAHLFAGISGHSSVTHFDDMWMFTEEPLGRFQVDAADHASRSILYNLTANKAKLPPIRFDCGSSDVLIEHNRRLHRDLIAAGIAHAYEEYPGGHSWPYWEEHLADALRFFAKAV